jgi:tRNA U34 5-methylaminomethyl-2-thiouridine-forming methyltransferase MnmC
MSTQIITTQDGSTTLKVEELQVTYHSVFGAVQESKHVFINAGLQYFIQHHKTEQSISIFEMGFGTGLNAWLSLNSANEFKKHISYTTLEPHPIDEVLYSKLNYAENHQEQFLQLHQCGFNEVIKLNEYFSFCKLNQTLQNFEPNEKFDLIYYDAFAPSAQPELWTLEIFTKIKAIMHTNSILVTYCAKGEVKRLLKSLGFMVENLTGPPGKREMIRVKLA